jgi:hypothetical protein
MYLQRDAAISLLQRSVYIPDDYITKLRMKMFDEELCILSHSSPYDDWKFEAVFIV